jgi:hypothetical protein
MEKPRAAGLLRRRLLQLRLGPREAHKNLTLWPLLPIRQAAPGQSPYVLLRDALEDGVAGVEMLDAPESRQTMRVENRGHQPLLVLPGEPLGGRLGGRARGSLLVPPHASGSVAVERPRSEGRDPRETAYARAIRPLTLQLGFVAARSDTIVGLELVCRSELLARALPELLAPYGHERTSPQVRPCPGPRFDAPEDLLASLARAPLQVRTGPGPGGELLLRGREVSGRAILWDGEVVHLQALPSPLP